LFDIVVLLCLSVILPEVVLLLDEILLSFPLFSVFFPHAVHMSKAASMILQLFIHSPDVLCFLFIPILKAFFVIFLCVIFLFTLYL